MKALISICARKGSKGLPSKNIRNFLGKPLIAHTIRQALDWNPKDLDTKHVVVSTDCPEIAAIARAHGAQTPFLRPAELATDTIGKMPVLLHAFNESEKFFKETFDLLIDLDPTAPVRRLSDLDIGFQTISKTSCDLCFSVTRARKNPYFNMVKRNESGYAELVIKPDTLVNSRQATPEMWDMNASIYVYRRDFLLKKPSSIWDGTATFFEMPSESAFDIDVERDLIVNEALMKYYFEISKEN